MGDIFIQNSSATISTFTNELGNGLTLEQFQTSLEEIDLGDVESIKKASGSCVNKCAGGTVVVSTNIKIYNQNCIDGKADCEFTTIDLENISIRI